jgi:hypothetical protein
MSESIFDQDATTGIKQAQEYGALDGEAPIPGITETPEDDDADTPIPSAEDMIPTAALRKDFMQHRYPGGRKPVSYREISDATGVHEVKISAFENEKPCSIDTVLRIANYLGYSIMLAKDDPTTSEAAHEG